MSHQELYEAMNRDPAMQDAKRRGRKAAIEFFGAVKTIEELQAACGYPSADWSDDRRRAACLSFWLFKWLWQDPEAGFGGDRHSVNSVITCWSKANSTIGLCSNISDGDPLALVRQMGIVFASMMFALEEDLSE